MGPSIAKQIFHVVEVLSNTKEKKPCSIFLLVELFKLNWLFACHIMCTSIQEVKLVKWGLKQIKLQFLKINGGEMCERNVLKKEHYFTFMGFMLVPHDYKIQDFIIVILYE